MQRENVDAIREIFIPAIEAGGAFLVDLTVRGERNTKIVEVYIDTEEGITAARLGEFSKELNQLLERHHIITGTYRLNVSSPGLDRPLKLIQQYKRNIGRELELQVHEEGELRKISGTLKEVSDDGIVLSLKKVGARAFPFTEIQKALIKLPW